MVEGRGNYHLDFNSAYPVKLLYMQPFIKSYFVMETLEARDLMDLISHKEESGPGEITPCQ